MLNENMWCPQCGKYWTPSPVIHECPCQRERRLKESANALQGLLEKKSKAAEEFKKEFLTIVNNYHDLVGKHSDKNGLELKAWEKKCKLWLDVDLFSNFSVTDRVGGAGFCSIEKIVLIQQTDVPKFMADYISENIFSRFDSFYNSCNQKLNQWLNQPNELCNLDVNIGNVQGSVEFLNALDTKLFSANIISRYKSELAGILKPLESKRDGINNAEQIANAESNFRNNQEFNFNRRLELIRKIFVVWLIVGGAFLLFYWLTGNAQFKEASHNYVQYYYYLFLWPLVVIKWIPIREILGKFIDETSNKLLLQWVYFVLTAGLLAFLYFIKFKAYKKSVWIFNRWAPWIYTLVLFSPLIYMLCVEFLKKQ